MSEELISRIEATFKDSIVTKQAVIDNGLYKVLVSAGDRIVNSIRNGGKLMICGNGGSAADAQHLVAEFLIRLTSDVNRQGIPAISLVQDTSTLTACINDYGQDDIFKRVLLTLGQEGDVLLAITTSGNSINIIETLKSAREKN
ncbi:MAG: SIS domain-containing protein, partial [Gammaproteobacteria bacterium]